jgi:hypothetical protein
VNVGDFLPLGLLPLLIPLGVAFVRILYGRVLPFDFTWSREGTARKLAQAIAPGVEPELLERGRFRFLPPVAFSVVLPRSKRRAEVELFMSFEKRASGGSFGGTNLHTRITLDMRPVPFFGISRRGLFDRREAPLGPYGLVVHANDREHTNRVLAKHGLLVLAIRRVFAEFRASTLAIGDGRLSVVVARSLPLDQYGPLVYLLEEIAELAAPEPVAVPVGVLGGERQALKSGGKLRCSYCHDAITGDEPDLVACRRCGTVLHEGCWREHGRCPVLGCDGRQPERGRERAGGA